jgi:hypothetical protein
MQLSRLYNKRVQNEADRNPESSSSGMESPVVADEADLPGSISLMCSTNPAVRSQRENVCPQIPSKDKLAPEVCDVARMSTAISGIFEVPAYRCAHPGM